uniref:Uncharacterized protein n=1 Tax=Trichobilharzia regenti TaxID=157069 RepID=A0AA85JVE2_TRIRE|nr:unnamed protein product [Trichobilharzia regenti]
MTDSVSSEVSYPCAPGSSNSNHYCQPDWRIQACKLLEQEIDKLKQENSGLVRHCFALASCVKDVLAEIEAIKTSSPIKPLDEETLLERLLHYQSIISKKKKTQVGTTPTATTSNATTFSTVIKGENTNKRPKYSPKYTEIKKHRISEPKQLPVHNNLKRKSDDSLSNRNYNNINYNHNNNDNKNNRPPCHKRYSMEYTDVKDIESENPELVRAAFRLFAKHIGPSLKREHRVMFNAPPTQDWLANQLLSRWEKLSSTGKLKWCNRLQALQS